MLSLVNQAAHNLLTDSIWLGETEDAAAVLLIGAAAGVTNARAGPGQVKARSAGLAHASITADWPASKVNAWPTYLCPCYTQQITKLVTRQPRQAQAATQGQQKVGGVRRPSELSAEALQGWTVAFEGRRHVDFEIWQLPLLPVSGSPAV